MINKIGKDLLRIAKRKTRKKKQINKIRNKRKKVKSESEVAQSCLTLCDPMDSSLQQAPLPMGFSRQEYWSGLTFPSPGNLPDPGIKPRSPTL